MMSATNPKAAGRNIPRNYDIDGAPFHIGATVTVKDISDPETFDYLGLDEAELDKALINQKAILRHYDYDCGCGQIYPDQPMIGVEFISGPLTGQVHEMWPEELVLLEH